MVVMKLSKSQKKKKKKKKKKKTGSSEELCVSVYLTMVFSYKTMKGLLIVLSVSVRLSVFVLR